MNKKILIGSISAVLMLVAISFASAVTTQTTRQESPLFKIRTILATEERVQNIKASYFGEQLSFTIPLMEEQCMNTQVYTTLMPDPTSQSSCCPATCYDTCMFLQGGFTCGIICHIGDQPDQLLNDHPNQMLS